MEEPETKTLDICPGSVLGIVGVPYLGGFLLSLLCAAPHTSHLLEYISSFIPHYIVPPIFHSLHVSSFLRDTGRIFISECQ